MQRQQDNTQDSEIDMTTSTINTKSTQIATFLIARGHKVVKSSSNGVSTLFYFLDTPAVEADSNALKYGDDLVSARSLFDARKYLLSLIHNDGGFNR